jgi:DNA-binding transcriptional regulator GbsR (MarR family)
MKKLALCLCFQFFPKTMNSKLAAARESFVTQWGAMGAAWGINRTMAQIHALLMISPRPLNTDEIMDALGVSRGNASTNLRELANWGLVRTVFQKGDRKDYFESEKDVWKMFCLIARERKRREVDPVLAALENCRGQTAGLRGAGAEEFNKVTGDLMDFVGMVSGALDRIGRGEQSVMLPVFMRLMK